MKRTCALLGFLLAVSLTLQAQEKQYTFRSGGLDRQYYLHVPSKLGDHAALIFYLHGHGQIIKPNQQDLNDAADRYGFVVCYPQGARDTHGTPGWNVGYPFQAGMKVDDVKFLCDLARHLHKQYGINPHNTFCTGVSNGGEMCYLLAYTRPDFFAAVAPIAGLTMEWFYRKYDAPSPIPLFELHGREDRVSEWTGDLENKGGWGSYLPVPTAVNYWVARNRCTIEVCDTLPQKTSQNGHRVVTHRYLNGTGGAEVWLYEVIGGGHSWASDDVDTAEELWTFFSKYLK